MSLTIIKNFDFNSAGGVFLKSVQTSPKTKEDRVRNLRNCLEFLCKRGVDISDLDPAGRNHSNWVLVLEGCL